MAFNPNYKITQNILNYLTKIENIKESFKNSKAQKLPQFIIPQK